MTFEKALHLINLCVEHNILQTHDDHVAICFNVPTGHEWSLIPKSELATILMNDQEGIKTLTGALKKRNIQFLVC